MTRTPALNLPPAVLWLSLVLIVVHVVRLLAGPAVAEWMLVAFAFLPVRYAPGVAAELPGGEAALFWSPVSYAFLHADFIHLFVNVVWMAGFGSALERRFGGARFLTLALLSAAAGAALHYLLHPGDESLVVGASAAVSGMMAATARFAFAAGGPLAGGRSLAAYRAPAQSLAAAFRNGRVVAFVLIWFAVNLLFGLGGGAVFGVDGPIAWEAHIGGFLAGLVLFPLLDPVPAERDPLAP
jgi:membrane associated rhomboid family serine protease